jgi:hypothetical protein
MYKNNSVKQVFFAPQIFCRTAPSVAQGIYSQLWGWVSPDNYHKIMPIPHSQKQENNHERITP